MLKANLPKSGNKPKNSANCEHSIFDLGDGEQTMKNENRTEQIDHMERFG